MLGIFGRRAAGSAVRAAPQASRTFASTSSTTALTRYIPPFVAMTRYVPPVVAVTRYIPPVRATASYRAPSPFVTPPTVRSTARAVAMDPAPLPAHTGHSIGSTPLDVGTKGSPRIQSYANDTLFNLKHDSTKQFVKRAVAFDTHLPAERRILSATNTALDSKKVTPELKQSSWMTHVQRGAYAGMDIPTKQRDAIAASYRSPEGFKHANVSKGAREAMAMMVRGEQGPLTREQSKHGAEIAVTGQVLGKRLGDLGRVALQKFRVDAVRKRDENGAISHQTKSPHGMDLSADPGTKMRDKLGLPVMSGTSGTSSDMALSHLYASIKQGVSPNAPGLKTKRATGAMTDLAFKYMRTGALPGAVAGGINRMRGTLGAAPKTVRPELVQTHSYPEVSAGVELSMKGSRTSLEKSSQKALGRLTHNAPPIPPTPAKL